MNTFALKHGDCLEKLKEIPDNSIDSIVTDPPYGLSKEPDMMEVLKHWMNGDDYKHKSSGFMGKEWDSFVPGPAVWRECLRVLKPGGHMLAFFGTRTYDMGVLAIRLAGFEVRNQIAWVYGGGMPKALDVSKAIDKHFGAERKITNTLKTNSGGYAHISKTNQEQGFRPTAYKGHSTDDDAANVIHETEPATPEAAQWEGWKSDIKPAFEPIVVARKPLGEKTIAENVLKWGVGALNIDECRVPSGGDKLGGGSKDKHNFANKDGWDRPWMHDEEKVKQTKEDLLLKIKKAEKLGRFPANLIHDGSPEVLEHFPSSKAGGNVSGNEPSNTGGENANCYGEYGRVPWEGYGDSGSAARFFKQCEFTKDDIKWQDQNHHQSNANIAETNSFLQEKVEFFVQNLVAIADSHEDNLLKNTIQPFMNEIRKKLKNNDATTTETIQSIGKKCERELRHISMELLKCNHVNYAEIQKLTNTMTIIQNLTNIDGFVDHVMSNCMLRNMVLGEKVSRIKYSPKASKTDRNEGLDDFPKKSIGKKGNGIRRYCSTCGASILEPHKCTCDVKDWINPATKKNNHPTVKPHTLCRYLVRLVTPKGGTVLDPFMGSGSTGKAAMVEGVDFIGIEMQKDFVEISRARIEHARKNLTEDDSVIEEKDMKKPIKKTVGDQFFDWGDDT